MKTCIEFRRLALGGLLALGLFGAVPFTRSYTPDPQTVTVTAIDPNAAEIGPNTGTFRVARTGGDASLPLVVYLQTPPGGSALSGTDYLTLPTYVTIPAYASTVNLTNTPILDVNCSEGNETVVLTLATNANYWVGWPSNATVTIADVPANSDSDGDGMLDCWELAQFGDLDETANGNADSDALTNLQEYLHGTNPNLNDASMDASQVIQLQVYTPLK